VKKKEQIKKNDSLKDMEAEDDDDEPRPSKDSPSKRNARRKLFLAYLTKGSKKK